MAYTGGSRLWYGKLGLYIVCAYFCTLFLILKCIPLYTSDARAVVTGAYVGNHSNRLTVTEADEQLQHGEKTVYNDDNTLDIVQRMDGFEDNGDHIDDATDCLSDVTGDRFRKINDKVYTYTAYLDDRTGKQVLRILAAVRKDISMTGNIPFWCHFPLYDSHSEITYQTTRLTFYEMCENHKRLYGGWLLTCAIPDTLKDIPDEVMIGYGHTNEESLTKSRRICIETRKKRSNRRKLNFGICVPPLYGDIKPIDLIEFVEFNRLLGADIFTMYVEESKNKISDEMEAVIRYYETRNVISVVRWQLPVKSKFLWYHGQSLAINDCLYRNMYNFNYLLFVDLDEFLIPQDNLTSWYDVMKDINEKYKDHVRNTSGFIFKSTIYAPEFSRPVLSEEMKVNVLTNRTKGFSFFRNKAMVLPERVFEMGIHHISRPWPDKANYSAIKVSSAIAHVHHYRKCVSEFGVHCERWITDTAVPIKYGQSVVDNVLKTMYDVTPY